MILDKAREIVAEQGCPEGVELRLRLVLEELGLTTGAAYNIWENQQHFQEDLAYELAINFDWASPITTDLDLDPFNRPLDEVVRLGNSYFNYFVSTNRFFVLLRFWGVAEISEAMQIAIRSGYYTNRAAWTEFFEAGLAWAERSLKADYTIDDLATAITVIVEGSAVRYRFDPDAVNATNPPLPGQLMRAAVELMTEPAAPAS